MTMPFVTVIEEQRVIAWPFPETDQWGRAFRARAKDRAWNLPLSQALERSYTTDAHFAAYVSPAKRRLKLDAAGKVDIELNVIVLDVDDPVTHGKGVPATNAFRVEIREKMLALRAAHHGFVYFETRGGSRIVYRLPVPHVIQCHDDAHQWKQDYATTVAYLERTFGIAADPACADWTRLFRLPRATRKAGGQPEPWPMVGDARHMQPLWFVPSEEDVARAIEILPKAFDEQSGKSTNTFTPYLASGQGLLYYALRNRGLVIRPFKGGTYLIQCPNEQSHTGGKRGDTSTILYPPGNGGVLGSISCLHAHCQAIRTKDWLKCFDRHELDRARLDAGLAELEKSA
ncbi:MAG TPA: hypothetical protein VGK73_31470 [Polyangiaceae bacterium]